MVAQPTRSPPCLPGKGQALRHAGAGAHSSASACASHGVAWFPAAFPALSGARQAEAQARGCPSRRPRCSVARVRCRVFVWR